MSKRRKNRPNRTIEIGGTTYKLVRVVDRYATDIHHILGRKYKDQYNVNIEQNKKVVYRGDHEDYNNFVKDKQSPREALQKMYEFCCDVLKEQVKARLVEILYNTEDSDFYIPELLKGTKEKKNTTNTATDQTDVSTT